MLNSLIEQIQNQNSSIVITPTEGSHKAYVTSQLYKTMDVSIVVILKDTKKALSFLEELRFFLPENHDQLLIFPGYNILPFKSLAYHRQTSTNRLAVLSQIMDNALKPLIVVTTAQTILQKIIPLLELM